MLSIRTLTIAALLAVGVLSSELPGQGYGYQREEDPLVRGVKDSIRLARRAEGDDRAELRAAIASLSKPVRELEEDLEIELAAPLERAVAAGDAYRIAYKLTEVVFHALRHKFHWNLRERLARHVPARARVDAAHFYYEEILSHAVRRADRAGEHHRHRRILEAFRDLRGTLGSPGLFGVGAREPDVEGFSRISARIETLLREVFPDFARAPDPESRRAPDGDGGVR